MFELELRGFAVVLADPERNDEVQESPHRLERLVEMGVLVQVTASSVDGRLGPRTRRLLFASSSSASRTCSQATRTFRYPPGRPVGRGAGARRRRARALADAGVPAAIVGRDRRPAERPGRRHASGAGHEATLVD